MDDCPLLNLMRFVLANYFVGLSGGAGQQSLAVLVGRRPGGPGRLFLRLRRLRLVRLRLLSRLVATE